MCVSSVCVLHSTVKMKKKKAQKEDASDDEEKSLLMCERIIESVALGLRWKRGKCE